jgi:hypothetical protein
LSFENSLFIVRLPYFSDTTMPSIMIIVREHVHIGPHVVHNHHEPLKQGINGLTGEMSEVLVLSMVGRIHPSLNLGIPNMSFIQHRLDSTSQVLGVHPIELRLTQSTNQVVDCLIVGVKHVSRSWREEVHRLDIAVVHRDIPKDLTLSTPPSAYSTSGSSCHQSVEDPNPTPGTPSLDLRLVRVNKEPNRL